MFALLLVLAFAGTAHANTFTISGSMEGHIVVANGDHVVAGYVFKLAGAHPDTRVLMADATVTITGNCSNGGSDTLTIPLRAGDATFNQPYLVASNNSDWVPTGDEQSPDSYESPPGFTANVCGGVGTLDGGQGATIHADLQADPVTSDIAIRFHYRDPNAKGKGNVDCSVGMHSASECGASWSGTLTMKPDAFPHPKLKLVKTQSLKTDGTGFTHNDTDVHTGDKVIYKIVVSNTGDESLSTTTLDGPAGQTGCDGPLTGSIGGAAVPQPQTIAAGASKTYFCDHTVTAADATSGSFTNHACTSGVDSSGTSAPGAPNAAALCDQVTVHVPKLKLVKTQSLKTDGTGFTHNDTDVHTGDKVVYKIVVTNTGDRSLSTTTLDGPAGQTGCDGPLTSSIGGPAVAQPVTLAAGASVTYFCDHTVTAADASNGSFTNHACVSGTTDQGTSAQGDPNAAALCDQVTVHVPKLKLVKTQSLKTDGTGFTHNDTDVHTGDKVIYKIVVTNTGDQSLSTTTLDGPAGQTGCDGPLTSSIGGPAVAQPQTIAAGASKTYFCDHTVTAADATNGSFTNHACVSGTTAGGTTAQGDPNAAALCDQVVVHVPKLKLVKTQSLKTDGTGFTHNDTDVHTGDKVIYKIVVTNTGDQSLSTTTLDGPAGQTGCDGPLTSSIGGPAVAQPQTIAAGASKTYFCDHTITAADASNGSFTNHACVSGTTTGGTTAQGDPNAAALCDQVVVHVPKLKLVKTQSLKTDGTGFTHNDLDVHVGDKVIYKVLVTNTGDVSLSTTTLDAPAGQAGCDGPLTSSIGGPAVAQPVQLAAGASVTYFCDHTVTAADATAGFFTNHACTSGVTAGGTTAQGDPNAAALCDQVTVHPKTPTLKLDKTQSLRTDGTGFTDSDIDVHTGDKVIYKIVVTNTGNVSLTTTTLDAPAGQTGCDGPLTSSIGGPAVAQPVTIAAGASETYFCDHTMTAADGNSFINHACVSGTDSTGTPATGDPNAAALCDSVQAHVPKLKLVKTQSLKTDGTGFTHNDLDVHVGDKVIYKVLVTNTGDVSLSTTTLDAPARPGCDGPLTSSIGGPAVAQPVTLAAGASVTYFCDHTVTAADATAGFFTNHACTSGVTAGGVAAQGDPDASALCDQVTVHPKNPLLKLDKTQSLKTDGTGFTDNDLDVHVGDTVIYKIVVTNTGNESLTTTTLDAPAGQTGCDGPLTSSIGGAAVPQPVTIAAGASETYFCDHTITAADGASFINHACVSGTDSAGTPAQGDPNAAALCDQVTVNVHGGIRITGTKFQDVNGNGSKDPGEGPLAGFTFYVDYNNNGQLDPGEPTATSQADGTFAISGITPGSFAVREVSTPGWVCSFPATCEYDVTFNDGDDLSGADFGNWQPGSISGSKFQDTNGNGAQDAGEGPLSGFTFYVDYNGNSALDVGEPAAVSAADGTFTITGIKPGSWTVREVQDPNFTCTAPAAGANCKFDMTVSSGSSQAGAKFGNQPPAQLVLPDRVTPGSAKLLGPTGCTAKAFNARVRGTKVAAVTFVLDGKTIKRFTKNLKSGLYQVRINPAKLKLGVHRLVVSVSFQKGTGTKAKKFRLSFQRCAKKLSQPRFTG